MPRKSVAIAWDIRPTFGYAALAALLVLAWGSRLMAQTAATISGHVSDTSGAAVPGAAILLSNNATQSGRSTISTTTGDYTFTDVPVGTYKLTVTHPGFKTITSNAIQVQVQQSVRLDFALQIGAVTESVEVQASSALLQAENATLGTVVENEAVSQLPLNGRNYLALVALASNANTLSPNAGQAGARLGGERASQSISVGGNRIMFDYFTLDGVNNTDPDFNTYVGLPSVDAIEEFKVQTGVYSAEFGHEASQVNVVSKSGTNTFHGSAYEFIRNNYVDANPYFFPYNLTPPKVFPFKWNNFGFELDGPIRIPHVIDTRNKFFFMIDDEWRHIRSVGQGEAVVPTAAMAAGDFSGYTYQDATGTHPITLYDPATGDANGLGKQPFPNNKIPSQRISPQSTELLKYLGTAPAAPTYTCTGSSCSVNNNYAYSTSSPQDRQSLTVRGDFIQSQNLQYAFRYSSGDESIISTGLLGAGSKIITNYYQYLGSNTWTPTPHLVNEARFGYTHFYNSLGLLSAFTHNVVDEIKIPGLSGGAPATWGIPDVSFGSAQGNPIKQIWSGFGDRGGDGPYVVTDPGWQIVDNVSWTRGKHSLRLGYEYNKQTFNQLGNQFSRGQFSSQPIATAYNSGSGSNPLSGGDSLADFLLGDLYQSTVAVAVANANYVRHVQSAYVDDTYKLLQNVTIDAGLRYELTPPWNDTYGNNFTVGIPVMPEHSAISTTYPQSDWPYYVRQGNCSPDHVYDGLNIRWTASTVGNGPPPVCSNGTLPNGPLMHTQYNNWAPRLGISYSPNATTVIRTGFGLFYSQDIGNAYFDMARNIAGRVTFTNANAVAPYGSSTLTWNNAVPGGGGGSGVALLPASTVAFVMAAGHKTPYAEQFLLNIQKQVGQNWSFEMGYQGAVSRHLYGFRNVNIATPSGYVPNGAGTSVKFRTPFANMGGIQYVHDEGIGNYNAFSVKATRRFSNGFNLIGSYTFGKSLDDTSGVRVQGNDPLFPQDNRCLTCDYGPSAFDVRNRIVVSALYELPFGPGKLVPVNSKALNALVGGWQVGGIFTHQTGAIATPQDGIDRSGIQGAGGNYDRPNVTGISPYSGTRTLNAWVNPAAYQLQPVGFFGNAGRGSFTGPGLTNLDASLHKAFFMPYNEKHQLSIRFEAFNALNHPNWNNPSMTITSSTFGRISGTGAMRQLQLAAKYQF
ncbi:TonB-dependent receptor [Occallatibacter riparius]|uniref:Carboxypeptidase-like regulatory domain-containing protein n=1 Tax=Occallatibacter riparius TaxID=1002689 RepID=A0A9J7BWK2_9BACT|nr:carboxypeptidase-like regulatory domain-containing protein [Occallatibacter riparius]UWZ85397.1 carboxypeptidase-like regulatory domain-containing protein [Occallatibacter riparius]